MKLTPQMNDIFDLLLGHLQKEEAKVREYLVQCRDLLEVDEAWQFDPSTRSFIEPVKKDDNE